MKKGNVLKLLLGISVIIIGIIMYKMYVYIPQNDFQIYKKNMLQYFPVLMKSMDENMLKMSREYNGYNYKGNDVYYQGKLLSGAYAKKFVILEGYGIDKQSKILYMGGMPISGLNIDSLHFIDELPLYIQDAYGYYFIS